MTKENHSSRLLPNLWCNTRCFKLRKPHKLFNNKAVMGIQRNTRFKHDFSAGLANLLMQSGG